MTQPRRTRQQRRQDQPAQEPPVQEPVIEERRVTTMATTRIPLDQMTDEQKHSAFQEWMDRQNSRKATNTAKRSALNRLKAAHEREYNSYLEEEKAKAMAGGSANGVGEDE